MYAFAGVRLEVRSGIFELFFFAGTFCGNLLDQVPKLDQNYKMSNPRSSEATIYGNNASDERDSLASEDFRKYAAVVRRGGG